MKSDEITYQGQCSQVPTWLTLTPTAVILGEGRGHCICIASACPRSPTTTPHKVHRNNDCTSTLRRGKHSHHTRPKLTSVSQGKLSVHHVWDVHTFQLLCRWSVSYPGKTSEHAVKNLLERSMMQITMRVRLMFSISVRTMIPSMDCPYLYTLDAIWHRHLRLGRAWED